jgi:hypothetical protein
MQVANHRIERLAAALDEQHDLLMSFVNETAALANEITITRAMPFTTQNRTLQFISALDHLNEFTHAIHALRNGHLSPALISYRDMSDALDQAEQYLRAQCSTCQLISKDPAFFFGETDFSVTRYAQSLLVLVKIPFATNAVRFSVYHIHSWPVPVTADTRHVTRLQRLATAIAVPNPPYGEYYVYPTVRPEIAAHTLLNIDNALGFSIKQWTCERALLEYQTDRITSLCQVYVYPNQLEPTVIRLNQSHVVLANTSHVRLTCANKSQETVPACGYCLLVLPCRCALTADQFTVASRFAGCIENDTQSAVKYFGINMAVLTKFFQSSRSIRLVSQFIVGSSAPS